MLKTTLRSLSLVILLCAFSFSILAQDAKPVYVQVNFIKVDRNKGAQYQALLNNYGRRIWKSRIAKGELLSAAVYTVGMHSGNGDYNYATVMIANSLNALLEPAETPNQILKQAMPGSTDAMIQEALDKYGEVRVLQNSVILRWVDGLQPNNNDPKIYTLDFMKTMPGKDADYVKMEKEVFKPMHQERMKAGLIEGWDLWEVVMPYADDASYGYVTTTGVKDWDKMASTDYLALYKKLFPKGDATKVSAMVAANRKISGSEIWRQVLLEEGK